MTPISAAIFDFGGVITTSPLNGVRVFAERHELSFDALRSLLGAAEGAWSRFERSHLSRQEFIETFEAEAASEGIKVDGTAFLRAFFTEMTVRQDMLAAVRYLSGRVKLACITNNVVRDDAGPRLAFALEDIFDVVVESSKVGMRKPDPEIYLHTCRLLDVRPEKAVFLDDFGVNLKAARALGMATIKVDDTSRALDELEAVLGLTLPRAIATGEGVAAAALPARPPHGKPASDARVLPDE